ncbi:hypothetical protein [Pelagibacterium sp. H642]|uniref:outer membrane protein n=1 Tax=Pelagibacterium sp. H642 TaxID=1881069 RepID=UPI002814CA98|nr:hypothetical protein [Pelagibacterium sp. H642]WMT89478.1 hypothetical protein NO934_11770 [Pelagibacterium sp. H642]
MKKLVGLAAVTAAAFLTTAALAADPVYPEYIPPYIPPVDEGLGGSFYLRGSVAGNSSWAGEALHTETDETFDIIENGWGYSAGIGAGYETGTGLRFDATVDYLSNRGMTADVDDGLGDRELDLRSTIVLANAYYDFGLSDMGLTAAGGAFGYVGAGVGVAFNESRVEDNVGYGEWGSNTSLAAAGMAGIGYDFGALVADFGYRGLYINEIENTDATPNYRVDDAWVHEVRATLRYRF